MRRYLASPARARARALTTLTGALALGALLLAPAVARAEGPVASPCNADPFFCESAGINFDRVDALPIQWSFDTGWVPQSSPLQVHIWAGVYANTHVTLAGALTTTWPEALTLEAPGKEMGGDFAYHYGAELGAQGKVQVTIAGKTYSWTGDIPYVPQFDFQVKGNERFDAWAYAPGVTLASKTDQQKIAKVSIGDIIGGSIPGIDGGFELDVAMELNATYTTEQVVIATTDGQPLEGGPITAAGGKSFTPYLSGPSIDLDVHPEGNVDYDGVLHLIPAFYISLLGQNFQIPIADIPLSFPITKTPWVFDAERVHVPLPDLVSPKTIDVGEVEVGQKALVHYSLWNAGEARVHAGIESSDPAVTPNDKKLDIDPGLTADSAIVFIPTQNGDFSSKLLVKSNDPSDPVEVIIVKGHGYGAPSGDTGEPDEPQVDQDSGCACQAAGRQSHDAPAGAFAALAVGAALLRARRGRRR